MLLNPLKGKGALEHFILANCRWFYAAELGTYVPLSGLISVNYTDVIIDSVYVLWVLGTKISRRKNKNKLLLTEKDMK